MDFMIERRPSPDGKMRTHRWASIAVCAVQDRLVKRTWQRAFDTMRIPSPDVPANSFRRLQGLAPAAGDLPLMPMKPEQLDLMLGRHRVSMVPVLFAVPISLMPDEDKVASRDRMLLELPAPSSSMPVSAVHRPLPALSMASGSRESIAGRVAMRRRTDSQG